MITDDMVTMTVAVGMSLECRAGDCGQQLQLGLAGTQLRVCVSLRQKLAAVTRFPPSLCL